MKFLIGTLVAGFLGYLIGEIGVIFDLPLVLTVFIAALGGVAVWYSLFGDEP